MDDRDFVVLRSREAADVVDAHAQLAGLIDRAVEHGCAHGDILPDDDRTGAAVPGAEAEADDRVLVGADGGECRRERSLTVTG